MTMEADCIVARDAIVRVQKELEQIIGTPNADFWLGVAKTHASILNNHLYAMAHALSQIESKK